MAAWWEPLFAAGGTVDDGLLRFGDGPDPWSRDALQGLVRGRWVEVNWHRAVADGIQAMAAYGEAAPSSPAEAARARWIEHLHAIAFAEGPICEVAAGPGGGWTPKVLTWNPGAHVVINDHSPGVLRLWKDFLARTAPAAHVCFAACDAARPAFRPDTLAAVTSQVGFGNIQGSGDDPQQRAIEHMYAALRPGGILLAKESFFDPTDWAHLDERRRRAFTGRLPDLALAAGERLERAGFEVLDRAVEPGRTMEPGQDGIAVVAAEFGVTLHAKNELIFAQRPE